MDGMNGWMDGSIIIGGNNTRHATNFSTYRPTPPALPTATGRSRAPAPHSQYPASFAGMVSPHARPRSGRQRQHAGMIASDDEEEDEDEDASTSGRHCVACDVKKLQPPLRRAASRRALRRFFLGRAALCGERAASRLRVATPTAAVAFLRRVPGEVKRGRARSLRR